MIEFLGSVNDWLKKSLRSACLEMTVTYCSNDGRIATAAESRFVRSY